MIRNKMVLNEKFTEVVSKYIQMGYTIYTPTMTGSTCSDSSSRVDFIKGNDFIRVYIKRKSPLWYNKELVYKYYYDNDIYTIEVGHTKIKNVNKFINDTFYSIYTEDLETIERYIYYSVGQNYGKFALTDDINDVKDICLRTIDRKENAKEKNQSVIQILTISRLVCVL